MVQGLDKLRRQLDAIPTEVDKELLTTLSASAEALVAKMNAVKPHPDIEIGWHAHNNLGGSVVVKQYRNKPTGKSGQYGMIAVRVHATGPRLVSRIPRDLAKAYEFGTAERKQYSTGRETGAMPSRPFFCPTYRQNKRAIRSRLRAAIRRAVKRVNT